MAKIFDLYSAHYESIKVVFSSAASEGDFVTSENQYGFLLTDITAVQIAASDTDRTVVTKAEKVKAAKATGVIVAGDALYYDESETEVTTTSTDNILVGFACEAAASADTHVIMNFNGSAAFLKA